MEQFVEGNENKKKRIRRDGRARKKKQSSNLLGDVTLTHICGLTKSAMEESTVE